MSSIKKFRTTDGDVSIDYNGLDNLPTIPSKTSELENDSEYINKNVGNLTNYYSKDEIDDMDLVTNNDVASSTKLGIISVKTEYGCNVSEAGKLYGEAKTKSQYESALKYAFISKGTLENIKTKTITEESTDTEIPTAKAVYECLSSVKIVALTQEEYDQMETHDENTLYVIK